MRAQGTGCREQTESELNLAGNQHEQYQDRTCAGDSRLPRKSHRRGRCHARGRHARPRRRALGRLHRRARSDRTARRRHVPVPGQGCAKGRCERQRGDRARDRRRRCGRPVSARCKNDRARRHAQQGQAGRQRAAGRQPGCRPCHGRRGSAWHRAASRSCRCR